ncbi:MAG: hypothetical protein WC712_04175 [Candidatus Brocadiia bacterium]
MAEKPPDKPPVKLYFRTRGGKITRWRVIRFYLLMFCLAGIIFMASLNIVGRLFLYFGWVE